jgi:hypothetical protein
VTGSLESGRFGEWDMENRRRGEGTAIRIYLLVVKIEEKERIRDNWIKFLSGCPNIGVHGPFGYQTAGSAATKACVHLNCNWVVVILVLTLATIVFR